MLIEIYHLKMGVSLEEDKRTEILDCAVQWKGNTMKYSVTEDAWNLLSPPHLREGINNIFVIISLKAALSICFSAYSCLRKDRTVMVGLMGQK